MPQTKALLQRLHRSLVLLFSLTGNYSLESSSCNTPSGDSSSSSSAFPAMSLGFTILRLLLPSQLYLWASPFFFSCLPSYISGLHHSSSSAFPAISLGFTILRLLLPSQLYISGLHRSSSSTFPAISLGFTILLLLPSQLYLWASPFFFFFCVPQLYLWASPFFFFFCVPQLYLWASPFFFFFFFFCVPSYISGVHHSSSSAFPSYISGIHHSYSSSSAFLAISLEFTILGKIFCVCDRFLIQP